MSGIKYFMVAGILIVLSACAIGASKHFPEQTGTVLEEGTDTPVEDAIVVARWEGWISQLVDSQSVCYHVETANTDKSGRYRIPEWSRLPGKVHHEQISYNVYKAGYRHVRSEDGMHYLERDTGGAGKRLEYLQWIAGYVSCGSEENQRDELLKLYEDLYREALRINDGSKAQKKNLNSLKYSLDVLSVGWAEAQKRRAAGAYNK